MMVTNWTDEQKKVIDLRDRNILVSAAAGSGKTAVLVERIIQIITNDVKKVDIDHILIVTFTNAAAAEMRERIEKAIEEKLIENPENKHIQKQRTLLSVAHITTIHSFCLNIIRNNFNIIQLDPSFRIAEQSELNLIKSDIIEQLLEVYYNEKNEKFIDFVESYSTGKTDDIIEKLILQLYEFSQSYPYPNNWLNNLKMPFNISSEKEFEELDCIKFLVSYINEVVCGLETNIKQALEICQQEDGPYMYQDIIRSELSLIENLKSINTYRGYSKELYNLSWERLSSKKDNNVSNPKREIVKTIRDEVKKTVENIKKSYFFQGIEEIIEDISNSKSAISVLINLVVEFSNAYSEAKISKNILDFNDLEHRALDILVKKDNSGNYISTSIANDLSQYYEEIVIDEYQDSNLVQEILLNSISKEKWGTPNIFMVGDVKQSIYKFRLARPEMFMEKYKTYTETDSLYQLVNLSNNFRSTLNIIEFINFIFSQIMENKLGNIDYDEKAALHTKEDLEINKLGINIKPELILIDLADDMLDENDKDNFEYTSKEIEAKSIAKKIKSIIDNNIQIYDKSINGLRNVMYKDIVILLRTISGWGDVFQDILMEHSIPAYSETSTGYFSSIEVQIVLSMLNVLDNPMQDIPLLSVLKSPIIGLTSNELATIKSEFKTKNIYDAIRSYIQDGLSEPLKNKLLYFINIIEKFRDCIPYTSIHNLIWSILDYTGYYNYILAMPSGDRRKANIDMLIEKAIEFESTSYKGLFNFIKYIDKIKQYDIDFGQTTISANNDNVVRIMSIHKSKGLEFPVVFVSGLGKRFNNQDAKDKIVIHSDLGIGTDYIDYKLRVKSPTIFKKIIAKKISLENLAEELRILYVGLTRAQQILILTGAVKQLEKSSEKLSNIVKFYIPKNLPFNCLASANTYLEWIIPALMRHTSFNEASVLKLNSKNSEFIVSKVNLYDLINQEIKSQLTSEVLKDELLNWNYSQILDSNLHEEIKRRLNWKYHYTNEINLHAKMTVTEVKALSQNIDNDMSQNFIVNYDDSQTPDFLNGFIQTKASKRGTIIHIVMQNIDFENINTISDIYTQLDYLVSVNKIDTYEKELVNVNKIYKFVTSSLCKRMINCRKNLFKEQQFIISMKAKEINNEFNSEEMILVQGVIDVYFEENGEMVIVDYKTDRVNNENILIQKYEAQLEYYKKAIEQTTNKTVKEKIIYSFELDKSIKL